MDYESIEREVIPGGPDLMEYTPTRNSKQQRHSLACFEEISSLLVRGEARRQGPEGGLKTIFWPTVTQLHHSEFYQQSRF